MAREPIIFHWDAEDDPGGNWQHVFEGHDVERDEVEGLIEDYWRVRAASSKRSDESRVVRGVSRTGRVLVAAFRIVDRDPLRVWVITCYPVET